ncbi:PXA domain-containing protein [Phycomyces nitens]|nr:PXA domain-containing protein [Phycomyces nitens]
MVFVAIPLRPLHLRILFPYILTLPKTDPRRINVPPDITGSKEIDLELYTYIALLVRDFINPWYRLVTNDEDLSTEIVNILTQVIQELQKRCRDGVDWSELILISVPNLLTLHYRDYRQAKERLYTGHSGGAQSIEDLFHGMQPHFALQSDAAHEAEYLRVLTDHILELVLKPSDYGSDGVRHLVREILANMVLASIVESLSDPYTIHLIISKLLVGFNPMVDELEAAGMFSDPNGDQQEPSNEPTSPVLTHLQSALKEAQMTDLAEKPKEDMPSTSASDRLPETDDLPRQLQRLQEKRRLQGDKTVDTEMEEIEEIPQKRRHFSFGYITLQVILAPFQAFWVYIMAVLTHSQERYHQLTQHQQRTRRMRLIEPLMQFLRVAFLVEHRVVLEWVWQMVSMFIWPLLRMFGVGVLVDKFLEQTILHFLSEDHLVFYLQLGRDLLWPNGVFLQRGEPLTQLEQEQMRIRAERLLLVSLPASARMTLFDTNDLKKLDHYMHEVLEPLQNKYINKHLMYLVVDLVASRLIPELLENKHTNSS